MQSMCCWTQERTVSAAAWRLARVCSARCLRSGWGSFAERGRREDGAALQPRSHQPPTPPASATSKPRHTSNTQNDAMRRPLDPERRVPVSSGGTATASSRRAGLTFERIGYFLGVGGGGYSQGGG